MSKRYKTSADLFLFSDEKRTHAIACRCLANQDARL